MSAVDFKSVTEVTGYRVTSDQIRRMVVRYRFAKDFCEGKDVLEVACGTGQGLGYLATHARRVVAGDLDDNILRLARDHYQHRVEIQKIDAQSLPFPDKSFDVVIMYEAIYYLPNPEKFVREANRVLKGDGVLLVCTANKDWSGFNPSPMSHRYFSAPELSELLSRSGFDTQLFAESPASSGGPAGKVLGAVKKLAVKFHLIPKTMKGKEILKRLFMGKLTALPPEVHERMAEYVPPVPIPHDLRHTSHKVIFAVGRVRGTRNASLPQ